MKEKSYNREYIKKKKSQQAFLTKAKFNPSHFHQPLKLVHPRKSQQKISNSLNQISSIDAFKRMSSLDLQPSQLSGLQQNRLSKQNQKIKKTIQHCWSQRHNIVVSQAAKRDVSQKRQKGRRFSSNSDFKQGEQLRQPHKRKLSLVQVQQVLEANKSSNKIEKLNVMTWLIIIRKLYVDSYLLRASKVIKINYIENYLNKIQNQHFQEFKSFIDPLDYQLMLSKNNILSILKQFFTIPKTQLKDSNHDSIPDIAFYEIQNCLMQYELKNMITNADKKITKSSSSQEQAVETARFQEGNAYFDEQKKKKHFQSKNYIQNIVPKIHNYKTFSKNNKQYLKFAGKVGRQKVNSAQSSHHASTDKKFSSLDTNLSPFSIGQNTINEVSLGIKNDKKELIFKKGSFQYDKDKEESLGIITLQQKSPCYLRGSQLFDLIQKDNSNLAKNNISFSTEHIEIQSNLTLENAVSYFQQILKKNAIMLKDSMEEDESSLKEQNSHQIRIFLQQLINYRLSMSSSAFDGEGYSYFVSFQDLSEFKEQSKKIMRQLLQNVYMKVYFNSLQGIKIKNSLFFLKSISSHLHQNIRILNISHNNISNLNFIIQEIQASNQMEFFNINNNHISDINLTLKVFTKLKELHCQGNLIQSIIEDNYDNKQLNMIDLSYNKIHKQSCLAGLKHIKSLNMINLLKNPLTDGDWKCFWSNQIDVHKIYQMENLYIMSAFGHQKDIAFSVQRKINRQTKEKRINCRQQLNDINVRQFNSTGEQSLKKVMGISNKQNLRDLQKVMIKVMPKQKISNIKAYIDGKIV